MRTLWVLILFGSLIIHHCFTTTSGEAVPTTKEAQPSYSDCKPYVDAALKGDIPTEAPPPDPADLSAEDNKDPDDDKNDSEEDAQKLTEENAHDDGSSEEDEPHQAATAQSSEEDDTEEPEINGLEIDEDEEDEKEPPKKSTTKDKDSSEEEQVAPSAPPQSPPSSKLPPPPTPPKEQPTKKTKAEEEPSEEDDGKSQESESDESESGKTAQSHSTPATPQPNRASQHSLAKDSHESPSPGSDSSTTKASKSKKDSHPPKETKAEVKPPVAEEESEESVEEVVVKKTAKESKEKPKKVEDDDDDSEEVNSKKAKSKKPEPKSKKIEPEEDDSEEEDEEPKPVVKKTKSKHSEPDPKPKKVEQEDDDSEEEEESRKAKKTTKSKKVETKSKKVEEEEDDDDSEEIEKSKKKVAKESEENDTEEDDSEEEDLKSKKTTKSKEKESKAKVKTSPKEAEESEEDDDKSVKKDYEPRSRDNLIRILGLDDTTDLKQKNNLLDKVTQQTLKELKNTYEYAIKPLETLYRYRDLSNRHFGDPEIFSKPMVVFMGPWSGGKSTIINWLLGIQDDEHALRTGADPSPAQFNILIHGNEEEVLDGTQLAADWTFSGLQKFGQSFLDRLRGRKLPNRLLEKVNLVEIPGILEIRKQVERSFPFNDACQWFIDRADVLFLVYDPAKLDIGPETEAILDQLKGRESQVRIVLNKADIVKPDELLRVQATLIWNISPLMASAEPPVLYVASLWDHPLQPDAPASLLNAHETLFLKDINDATLKRVETRIAAARRFAVRVRNHAKMCDCYLNTYNNHRSFFSNKKRISDDIIEHPQNYHIYEGLSTLTNISRYDLPDPDSYRDFFRLNPVWEFPSLASTCTYFRGCPINKLDIAIAYDLPELLGRYRRQRESIVTAPTGTLPDIKLKDAPPEKKDAPIDIPKGKSRWYKLPPEEGQEAEETPTPSAKDKHKSKHAPPAQPPKKDKEPPPKGKNKWWKEVPEPVAKPEVKAKETEQSPKKAKKVEVVQEKLQPKEGFKIVQPTNKWYKPYYEQIKPKEKPQEKQQPKKNKWYKT